MQISPRFQISESLMRIFARGVERIRIEVPASQQSSFGDGPTHLIVKADGTPTGLTFYSAQHAEEFRRRYANDAYPDCRVEVV